MYTGLKQNQFLFKTGHSPLISKLAQNNYKHTNTHIYMLACKLVPKESVKKKGNKQYSDSTPLDQVPYWAVQWSWFARVNTLCNLSRKKSQGVAASLPGRFLSRRCFMLCITMEAEPWIAKQYKCHHCCITGKCGWGGVSLRRFGGLTRISRLRGKKCLFRASYSTSKRLLLVARHILTTGLQKCL